MEVNQKHKNLSPRILNKQMSEIPSIYNTIDQETAKIANELMKFPGIEVRKSYLRLKYRMAYNRMALVFQKLEEFGFENKKNTIVVPLVEK